MDNNITNDNFSAELLKNFYLDLPARIQGNFRDQIRHHLEWTYPVWRNKINGVTPIKRLEKTIILKLIDVYYETKTI